MNSKLHLAGEIAATFAGVLLGAFGVSWCLIRVSTPLFVVGMLWLLYCMGFGLLVLRQQILYQTTIHPKAILGWVIPGALSFLGPLFEIIPETDYFVQDQEHASRAAQDLGYPRVPAIWKEAIANFWVIRPTDTECGGKWAWFRPDPDIPTHPPKLVGCVCHTDLSEHGFEPDLLISVRELVGHIAWLLTTDLPKPALETCLEIETNRLLGLTENLQDLG